MENKSRTGYASSLKGRITMMFVALALIMEGLFLAYWILVLKPRLEAGVESNIRSLAQSQTLALAAQLSRPDIDKDQIVQFMDNLLLLKDPSSQTPLVLSLELEMDYDVVHAAPGSLDLVRRTTEETADEPMGYNVEVPLFSSKTKELLGIAKFHGSKAFFRRMKRDVATGFFLGTLCIFFLLFLSWWTVIVLLRPLNTLVDTLRRRGGDVKESMPRLKGVVSDEVRLVNTALDDLFSRIREDTSNLTALNVILSTQQETSLDAILVLDQDGRRILSNQRFFEMWTIPQDIAASMNKNRMLDLIVERLAKPDWFQAQVAHLHTHPKEKSQGEIVLNDGRVVDHYSSPMFDAERNHLGRVWYFRDITERKRMELAIEESEERLDLALSSANEGIWDWRIQEDTLFLDSRYYTMAGYQPNEFPEVFDEIIKRIHPDDVERVTRANDQYLAGELDTFDVEYRFLRKDGHYMWIQAKGKVVTRDDRGNPARFIGTQADITELKQMQTGLEMFRFTIDQAPDAVFWLDREARFTYVNGQACHSLGYTREEMENLCLWDIDPIFPKKMHVQAWEQFQKGSLAETQQVETLHQRKDGSIFPVDVMSRQMWFGDTPLHVTFVRDITQRKQTEEELRQLRNYLANIINSMPSVLVGVDVEGRVTQWNRQAERETGMTFEKARSRPLTDVFPQLKDQMAHINKSIEDSRVVRTPKRLSPKQGETRFEDVTIFPLVANGVEGAVIRVDDVTEQVRLEEMMIQSEKMLSVGGLAAGMAHEINNPLAGILQNISVVNNRLFADLPANVSAAEKAGTSLEAIRQYLALRKLPEMLANIRVSGERAAAIVKNMLSFARKSDRIVSSQDLGELLDRTIELAQADYDMKKRYDFRKIAIVRKYEKLAPPVPCEGSKIQQVFLNILKNGAEAMATATPAQRTPTFTLRVKDDDLWVRVEIEDNGPGMDDRTRRRVFEPFFTTKPVGKGTGLGLSISYFIITENHGGEMVVNSREGGGAHFIIRLPKRGKASS